MYKNGRSPTKTVPQITPPLIVGIAGGSGSGKSTIARELIQQLGPNMVTIIPQDDYYDRNQIATFLTHHKIRDYNFDDPCTLDFKLMRSHIDLLRSGKSAPCTGYTYHDPRCKPGEILSPAKILIIDGLHVLAIPLIRETLDIKIYIDAPEDLRKTRRIARDKKERNFPEHLTQERFINMIKPMHDTFVEPSKKYADLILSGDSNVHEVAHRIATLIEEKLATRNGFNT